MTDKDRIDYLDGLPVSSISRAVSDTEHRFWFPWTLKIAARGETPQFQTVREAIDFAAKRDYWRPKTSR